MAVINIPDQNETIESEALVRSFMDSKNIFYDRWEPQAELGKHATQEEILAAFASQLESFMEKGGYKTADVISVFPDTPNLLAIRKKFLSEHTHTEDEVRYFVEGQGLFWFNLGGDEPVFSVLCQKGDILSVPAGTKHWFDLGPEAHVRAIRIFSDESGWVANYTDSKTDERYNPTYA
jgi:1,2-dihydroxy-3-keto-5-methylthiopentene dioxygenase